MRLLEQLTDDIVREISPDDPMYDGDDDAYFGSGASALRCIRLAMLATGKKRVDRILDLPCGYGRSLRMLKAGFPNAELVACDIDPSGVEFCSRVFGATPLDSSYWPDEIEIPFELDLVWCGSLFTHLDAFRWNGFLSLFERSLAADGLVVFTTHGRLTADRLRTVTIRDFARPTENMTADFEAYGFAYSDYYDAPREYGVSLSSPSWVCGELAKLPHLRLVSFAEAGWHSEQDVVACERTQTGG